jgi:O-antigen/teichoic acid export membrane protein
MVAGTMLVGVYSNYLMLSNKLLLLEQLIFSSLTASIGNVIVKENAQKKGAVFQAMQSVSFIFCGIISSIFCLMANDMIRVWLGESFLLSNLTVIAIALNTYLCCVLLPLWVYRDASGLYQRTKYMMLIGAVINILLSFFLGRIMGICGVLFASAIARVSTYLWYEPKLLYQIYFKQKVGGYYLSIIGNLFLVVITVMFLSVLTARIPVVTWKLLFVKGAVVGIVCSMIFLCAYARTQGFQMIWNKFKTTISKHRVAARRI